MRRGLFRDVDVSPHAFEVRGLGTVRKHTSPAYEDLALFAPENVERAHFDVIVLPRMSLVWGGLWILLAGMALHTGEPLHGVPPGPLPKPERSKPGPSIAAPCTAPPRARCATRASACSAA